MPPEEKQEGILLNISPMQFISTVGGIATTIVGVTLYVVLNYTPISSHDSLSQKHDDLSGKTTGIIEENAKIPAALSTMTSRIEILNQELANKIADVDERQLKLRRGVLISIKDDVGIAGMTKAQKAELRAIEEMMLEQGYLSPAAKTQGL